MKEKIKLKENKLKRETRDIVFREAFATEENLPLIYHAIFPDDPDWKNKTYKILNLETVITNSIQNDLAFSADEKVILIEAVSSWKKSDLTKFGNYTLAVNVQAQDENRNFNLILRENFVNVLYVGDREHPKKKYLALDGLKEEIDPARSLLNFEIDVWSKYNNNIPNGEVFTTYVRFCDLFAKTVRKYGRTIEAVKKLIDTCIENDIYADFFRARKVEVMGNAMYMFTQAFYNEEQDRKIKSKDRKIELQDEKLELAENDIKILRKDKQQLSNELKKSEEKRKASEEDNQNLSNELKKSEEENRAYLSRIEELEKELENYRKKDE